MSPFTLKGENHHAVLLLHAFASNCVDHNLVAKALNRAGYTVKAINFTGHGTGNIGDVLDATPEEWITDAKAAVEELRAMDDVDGIAVFGLSLGGMIATRLLIDVSNLVAGGNFSSPIMQHDAADSNVPEGFIEIARMQMKQQKIDNDEMEEKLDSFRPRVLESLKRITECTNALQTDLHRLVQPYFVASAGEDEMVDPDIVDEIADTLDGQVPVTHHRYPESKHAMTVGSAHRQLQEDLLSFLAQCEWK